jgi:RND family efflux transporter MFP subunit
MKVAKVARTLIVLAVVTVAAIVVWPQAAERVMPGSGERAAALRTYLPKMVVDKLPAYAKAGGSEPTRVAASAPSGPATRPAVPVNIETASRGPMPYRIDAVGTVQPIASIALKARVDAQIDKIFAADGAVVKAGDVLVKLDSRQIEAQVKQTEATISKDEAAIEQSMRDVTRYQDLFSKGSGTQINLDNAKTSLASGKAQLAADQALLENQKVQLSWYTLVAPISGRVGTFSAKAGNIIRAGDNTATGTLATIVQTAPIYVTFSVPQIVLSDLREAVARGVAMASATPQGSTKAANGKIAFIDNTIDAATGSVSVRAVFENADDFLWAGQLCNIRVTVRVDPDVVSIPRTATQAGQIGNYVYVVENGVARVRNVKVLRFQDGRDVISEGLNGNETLVTDGALQLVDGGRVNIKKSDTEKGAI